MPEEPLPATPEVTPKPAPPSLQQLVEADRARRVEACMRADEENHRKFSVKVAPRFVFFDGQWRAEIVYIAGDPPALRPTVERGKS